MTPLTDRSAAARVAAPALALLLAACGGGKDDAPAFAVRDSAGVRIAESARPAWGEGEGWTVGQAPRLEIALRDGFIPGVYPDAEIFRAPDGRIAVSHAGGVALYRADGTAADTIPLPEQDYVGWMGTGAGDSLMVWTVRKRLYVLSPAGTVARRAQAEGLHYIDPDVLGRLADGTLLVTEGHQDHVTSSTPRRGLVRHLLLGPDGATRGPFADLPDAARMRGLEMPFSPTTVVATRGGEVLVGDNRAYEFAVHAPDGALKGIVRRPFTPLAVTPEDVETWHLRRESPLSEIPRSLRADVQARRAQARRIPAADTFPAYARMLVDGSGHVWAEDARRPGEYHALWSVFHPDGRWLGTVRMPSGFVLRQVGPDWVLGTEPSPAGRPVVRLYPLARTPAGS